MANPNPPSKLDSTDEKELRKLLARAQQGDELTLPAVREMLKDPKIMNACGDMAHLAEEALIRRFTGKDVAVREATRCKIVAMRAELSGPSPLPLEGLLVERIIACWLHLYQLELVYATKESMSLELAAHYQRCIDRAHKRYLTAIKTLAVVRRLAVPVLVQQVNVAAQQRVQVVG